MSMSAIYTDPEKRHDFVFLFDVVNGNPNGDPDAGNLPRVDPETMHGLVTDVCLKRKIRNYVSLVKGDCDHMRIFIQSEQALNTYILEAFRNVGIEPVRIDLSSDELEDEELIFWLKGKEQVGFLLEENQLLYSGEAANKKEIVQLLTEDLEGNTSLRKKLDSIVNRLAEEIKKGKRITRETRKNARRWLCSKYFDIRMFGAVLSTGLNAGQVRGPIQLTFARSIDPVVPMDISITRVAITKEEDRKRKETEMGRKPIVPYGLYRSHGFYNPFLAKDTGVAKGTGVTREDLELFWEALMRMFEFDRSAARGEMSVRGLWIFTHENEKGNAPAHKLFELIRVKRKADIESPRSFTDYEILEPSQDELPSGVVLTRLV